MTETQRYEQTQRINQFRGIYVILLCLGIITFGLAWLMIPVVGFAHFITYCAATDRIKKDEARDYRTGYSLGYTNTMNTFSEMQNREAAFQAAMTTPSYNEQYAVWAASSGGQQWLKEAQAKSAYVGKHSK